MATIVFADHRLIFHFMENCEYDINKLGCGRFPRGQNEAAVPDSVCLLLSTVCGVYSQGVSFDCGKSSTFDPSTHQFDIKDVNK